MQKLDHIKGLLIDLEGVVYTGDHVVPGAIEAIHKLNKKFKIKYITNTTTTSRNSIFNKLKNLNLPLIKSDIFTPSVAVADYLRINNINNIYLMANLNILPDSKDLF